MVKSVVFTFGRFQPITTGHAKLIHAVIDAAKKFDAEGRIYASHSHDNKRNPLPYKDKISFLKQLFPNVRVMNDPALHAFAVLEKLNKEKYTEVRMVVGSDRVNSFKTQITKYLKDYNFKKFDVISAGERDPDATDVSGISGTKLREFARNNDFGNFRKGVPTKDPLLARKIFNTLRQYLKENEEMNEEWSTKNHKVYGKVLARHGQTHLAPYDEADKLAEKHKGTLIKSLNPKRYIIKMPEINEGSKNDKYKKSKTKTEAEITYNTVDAAQLGGVSVSGLGRGVSIRENQLAKIRKIIKGR